MTKTAYLETHFVNGTSGDREVTDVDEVSWKTSDGLLCLIQSHLGSVCDWRATKSGLLILGDIQYVGSRRENHEQWAIRLPELSEGEFEALLDEWSEEQLLGEEEV